VYGKTGGRLGNQSKDVHVAVYVANNESRAH